MPEFSLTNKHKVESTSPMNLFPSADEIYCLIARAECAIVIFFPVSCRDSISLSLTKPTGSGVCRAEVGYF